MLDSLNSLKALLPQVRQQTDQVRQTIVDLRDRLKNLATEREALMRQALSREDYITVVHADIDRVAELMRDRFVKQYTQFVTAAKHNAAAAATVDRAAAVIRDSGKRNKSGQDCFGSPTTIQSAMADGGMMTQSTAFFLFRDEIKRASAEAIEAVEPWPLEPAMNDEGEPITLDGYFAMLDSLDAEAAGTHAELVALTEKAMEMGLELPPPPPPPPRFDPSSLIQDYEPVKENAYRPPA
jgi:hypothetical protein